MFALTTSSALHRPARRFVVASLFLASCFAVANRANAVVVDPNSYAAVAFSTSTGAYGYAWNYSSRGVAEAQALARCNAADARIVGWVNEGWLVLAVGDNNSYGVGWEYGGGARLADATRRAIDNCKQHCTKVVKVICLCSGDFDPEIVEIHE